MLTGGGAQMPLSALARRLDRSDPSSAGWALLALPAALGNEELQVVAAGVLAALGRPFNSIRQGGGRMWIGQETTAVKEAASLGGTGAQALHIDAPNVEHVPEYTSLLVLRGDPAGGGASLLGDLREAMARLGEADRQALREPVFFEGRAENLRGVGAPRMPFRVAEHLPRPADPGRLSVLTVLQDGEVAVLRPEQPDRATTTRAPGTTARHARRGVPHAHRCAGRDDLDLEPTPGRVLRSAGTRRTVPSSQHTPR
ncbi:TauD/TfdA family dioxygenase [Streptomyces sp. NPDC053720]|uniref:TauD/TfdA family dioxygenase n=1 Tax=Streptomyces sp. NPDC053720 TaxID=3154855 RepID=UPI00341EAD19